MTISWLNALSSNHTEGMAWIFILADASYWEEKKNKNLLTAPWSSLEI